MQAAELSPGVRRMMVLVGPEVPFHRGRAPWRLLADLAVPTKAVERTAEAIGRHMLACPQQEIHRAKQLTLAVEAGPRMPILSSQIDGTGVPVVMDETQGRKGKPPG